MRVVMKVGHLAGERGMHGCVTFGPDARPNGKVGP
jgi:hypothetical protein